MKNELMVMNDVEKRLKAKNKITVFPLTPTHRKELRDLRKRNLGNLNEQLRIIRKLKEEEYFNKYKQEILKENANQISICVKLNDDWNVRLIKINKIITERKSLEVKYDHIIKNVKIKNDYGDISCLKEITSKRWYSVNELDFSKDIAKKEFEEKYGTAFKNVQEKINDLSTKYEEAINFGDLEIVKELYYYMKSADGLFKQISELKM